MTFTGCPGWCNSFAELLGYVLRDAGKEMVVDVDGLKKMIDEITDGYPARQILGVCVGGGTHH
ncbi:MAG: DUF2124 domain-containing protein [Euryarchaeota archaeon]|nr:DUF2124 domain-containing protein [Euryarchaeota archaeon]MBU4491072.1 DUF2124 domain-containing protein [Euryarchaeota archaeon]